MTLLSAAEKARDALEAAQKVITSYATESYGEAVSLGRRCRVCDGYWKHGEPERHEKTIFGNKDCPLPKITAAHALLSKCLEETVSDKGVREAALEEAALEEAAKICDQVAINAERRAAGYTETSAIAAAHDKMEAAKHCAELIRLRKATAPKPSDKAGEMSSLQASVWNSPTLKAVRDAAQPKAGAVSMGNSAVIEAVSKIITRWSDETFGSPLTFQARDNLLNQLSSLLRQPSGEIPTVEEVAVEVRKFIPLTEYAELVPGADDNARAVAAAILALFHPEGERS